MSPAPPRHLAAGRALRLALGLVAMLVLSPASASATFPGHNGSIAYLRSLDDRSGIFEVRANGTHLHPLREELGDLDAAYSADGRRVAFSRGHCTNPVGECDAVYRIFVMAVNGEHARRLTSHHYDAWDPSFAPNGRHIVYQHGSHAFKTGLRGGRRVRLIPGYALEPTFSPMGDRIAFAGGAFNRTIATVRPDGSRMRKLVRDRDFRLFNPRFSPDGSWIVFERHRSLAHYNERAEIVVVRVDGTHLRRLTLPKPGVQNTNPVFSPNGRRIVFCRQRDLGSRRTILTMLTDGSHMRRVNAPGAAYPLDWQPLR